MGQEWLVWFKNGLGWFLNDMVSVIPINGLETIWYHLEFVWYGFEVDYYSLKMVCNKLEMVWYWVKIVCYGL